MKIQTHILDNKDIIRKILDKGGGHILVGNFATKFVTFFGSIFLVKNLLTKTEYGVLGYMENLCSFAYILMGLGLSNALLRYGVLSQSIEKKYAYYKWAITRSLVFDFVLAFFLLCFNYFYKHPLNYEVSRELFPILVISLPFQQLTADNQMNERALFQNKRYAFVSLFYAITIVGARLIGAYFDGVKGVLISILVVNILYALLLDLWEEKCYFNSIEPSILTKEEKRVALKYSIQYTITNGLWAFFMLIDIFLIGRLIPNPDVLAEYKVAYAFPANMAIVSGAIGVFIAPYFVKHESDYLWVKDKYLKVLIGSIIIIGVVSAILFVFTPLIIRVFYGVSYLKVVPLMRTLTVSSFINCALRYTTANILAAMGKVKYNMIASALGVIIQIGLDLFLINRYAEYGVAVAGIITYSLMAVFLFTVFNAKYNIFLIGQDKNA